MIYALCDPRKGRQEIYIGKTVDEKTRLATHIRDGKSAEFTYSKLFGLKISYKDVWIKQILSEGLKPIMIVVDNSENFSESDWIKKFAEDDFILQNSRIDVENCLNGYGLYSNGCKNIPDNIYIDAVKKIKSYNLYPILEKKIFIDAYIANSFLYGDLIETKFGYHSYPTRELEAKDIEIFQKEYHELQSFFEGDCSSSIITCNDLYLMDTDAKLAFFRDYLNNDLLGFVLEQIAYTESEEEDSSLISDIELLLSNKSLVIKNSHKQQISFLKDIWTSDDYKFLLNYCDFTKEKKVKRQNR